VVDVVERLTAALQPDETVIGGGNVNRLDALPPRCRAGHNANAFRGGFRLWAKDKLVPPDLPPGRARSGRKTLGLERTRQIAARSENSPTCDKGQTHGMAALQDLRR